MQQNTVANKARIEIFSLMEFGRQDYVESRVTENLPVFISLRFTFAVRSGEVGGIGWVWTLRLRPLPPKSAVPYCQRRSLEKRTIPQDRELRRGSSPSLRRATCRDRGS